MKNTDVQLIHIDRPIVAVGKTFLGDYARSQEYVAEVQANLACTSISFIPNKVIGIYYDNPQDKPANELKCFQGVLLNNENDNIDSSLQKVILEGTWLHIILSGDPMKSIYDGYTALFAFVQSEDIVLRSNAGYQISTFEKDRITTDIYLEVSG